MQGLFAEAPLNKTNTHITHGDNAQEGQARVQEFILCLKDFLSIAVFGFLTATSYCFQCYKLTMHTSSANLAENKLYSVFFAGLL